MKKLFWVLWALGVVPVSLFYMNPFLFPMKPAPLSEIFMWMSVLPFCIVGVYTLALEVIWGRAKLRQRPVWRLPVVSGLGVSAVFWAKVIVMTAYAGMVGA